MNDGRMDGQDGQEREELPRAIHAAAEAYHRPPPTPRQAMWTRIEASRRAGRKPGAVIPLHTRRPRRRVWLTWGVGIAATLLLGIGLGRYSSNPTREPPPVAAGEPAPGAFSAALDVATGRHLSRVEVLLTMLRAAPDGADFQAQARDLLASTRLLLDAEGLDDSERRRLLHDLEVILVQIAQLDRSSVELDFILDGLEARQVLPRIQTAIPAGPTRL